MSLNGNTLDPYTFPPYPGCAPVKCFSGLWGSMGNLLLYSTYTGSLNNAVNSYVNMCMIWGACASAVFAGNRAR